MGKDKLCLRKTTSSLVSLSLSLSCMDGSPWSKPHSVLGRSDSAGVGHSMSPFTHKARYRIVHIRERGGGCVVLDLLCCELTYHCVLCKICVQVFIDMQILSREYGCCCISGCSELHLYNTFGSGIGIQVLFCFICAREHLS